MSVLAGFGLGPLQRLCLSVFGLLPFCPSSDPEILGGPNVSRAKHLFVMTGVRAPLPRQRQVWKNEQRSLLWPNASA